MHGKMRDTLCIGELDKMLPKKKKKKKKTALSKERNNDGALINPGCTASDSVQQGVGEQSRRFSRVFPSDALRKTREARKPSALPVQDGTAPDARSLSPSLRNFQIPSLPFFLLINNIGEFIKTISSFYKNNNFVRASQIHTLSTGNASSEVSKILETKLEDAKRI